MIAALQRFVDALRREGLASSPAEWIDAVRAVEWVGLTDRVRFRAALRCTLVKRDELRPVFDRTFDRFFAPPGPAETARKKKKGSGGAGGAERRRATGEGSGRRERPAEKPRAAAAGERRADVERAAGIRRRLSAVAQGKRERRLRRVVLAPAEPRDAGAAFPGAARPPERRELREAWTAAEEREVADRLPRIVERIRLRTGRRRRRAVRGRPYPRRAFRDNLAHGGVPFVLSRRRELPRRSRFVLCVDVSWSTARAAGLFLSMAGALARWRETRVLLFVDRFVDATRAVERWLLGAMRSGASVPAARGRVRPGAAVVRGEVPFAQLVDSLGDLHVGAPSDYGRAFHGLLRSTARPRGRGTALVVLGDGRSNRLDPQAWAFEEIAESCGTVVWMVPEPVDRWGTGDSALFEYLPAVDLVVEAGDLAGLSRGVAEIVRLGSR